MASRVKNAALAARAKVSRADWPRDPVTHRWVKREPGTVPPPADPSPTPPLQEVAPPAGGDAPASDPFRGRVLGRLRPSGK
jgi:hypothetical protein